MSSWSYTEAPLGSGGSRTWQSTYRLSKVAALLLVPPISVGVSELALLKGRVDVSSVLAAGLISGNGGGRADGGTHLVRIGDIVVRGVVLGRERVEEGLGVDTDDEGAGSDGGEHAGAHGERAGGGGQSEGDHLGESAMHRVNGVQRHGTVLEEDVDIRRGIRRVSISI